MQKTGKILPQFIDVDVAYNGMKPDTSPFMKGLTWDINGNPEQGIATNNPSGEGQNLYALTPTRSNERVVGDDLPSSGWNLNVGSFESTITKELYSFTFNSLGYHTISVLNGETGTWKKVITDPKLAFSDDPESFINLRATIRIVTDKDNNIIEKYLMWTNGKKWQGWINVMAAMATNGLDETLFPYWKTLPPHFDREELLEWPVRPPMVKPVVVPIANTAADIGKTNRIVDKGIRFAVAFKNTDGRTTTLSPYSLPLLVKSVEYINNPNFLPRKALVTLPGGSPLTEKALLYVSFSGEKNTLDPTATWGDWVLYDTINKYADPPDGQYWTRTSPWPNLNYNSTFNTFEYQFDNSRVGTIASIEDTLMLQTAMPQISQALADMDDSVLLCGNRYNYNNLSEDIISKLSAIIKEKSVAACSRPIRTVVLYAYIGKRSSGHTQAENFAYQSQVGYTYGTDTKVRFGGIRMVDLGNEAEVDYDESKFFDLDFSDKTAFRCYLKGTPYYTDGEWCIVKADNSIEPITSIYDLSNQDTRVAIQNILQSGSYFMCRFTLKVPAGRYIAAIGRHNVASSGDYRNTSSYVYGIANSRAKTAITLPGVAGRTLITVPFTAINSEFSKEMEVDCTSSDVDVWGNGNDLFYIYCPHNRNSNKYRFIEGYFKESQGNPIGVDYFPYQMSKNNGDDWGRITDKNGFYWGYTRVADSASTDIQFSAKINCGFPTVFIIATSQTGIGWMKNADSYLASHTNQGGAVGGCNRILIRGRITNIGGTIGYSNIGVSVKDGPTVYSDSDGNFELVVHSGKNTLRTSNIYINAGGNYIITTANCGYIPLTSFSETLAPCSNCAVRIYPLAINQAIEIQSNNQTSLKDGGKYNIGFATADLAGRMTFVNVVSNLEVSTILQRNGLNATYIQLLISGLLNFLTENPDMKWFAPYVSNNTNTKRYIQWAGDKIQYLDSNGRIVSDSSTATFVKIILDSLYNANISSNFTLLSNYQFVKGDRVLIIDDGNGNVFNTAAYGDPLNVPILGTNYNEAAINAGLLTPQSNVVLDNSKVTTTKDIGLIVKFDARFSRLENKTGFWIEVQTPVQQTDQIPFFEIGGFYPIINGAIAQFTGYGGGGQPTYNYLTAVDIDFWDTYFTQRSINGKYFNHSFESPNATDTWGANLTSGGRINVENKNAEQIWLGGDTIRSDSYVLINGLATFREKNRKDFGVYPFGPIVAAHAKRNIIAFNCTNDWFTAEFNMPYTKVSNGTLVVTNLDENLSMPMKKDGAMLGLEPRDIRTVVVDDDFFFWFDRKNTSIPRCNYGAAVDISQQAGEERGGLQSYLNTKSWSIGAWDNAHSKKDRFDVAMGIDGEKGNIYLTFRPRRGNSNHPLSYVNQRRSLGLLHQETFVYSIQYKGWLPCVNFTPESYARLRGNWANVEFITFAAGVPYIHNNSANDSYLKFYGVQCEPVLVAVLDKEGDDASNIIGSISQEINGSFMFSDIIYENQLNSFSYIPANRWKSKEKSIYAEVLRDMVSYPPVDPAEAFRSMLFDGKRVYGNYIICRFVQNYQDLGKYFQLTGISYLFTNSFPTKP